MIFKNFSTICNVISSPLAIDESSMEDLAKNIAILFPMDNSDVELQLNDLKNDVTLFNF
jgi:hypothetical protein